MVDPTNPAVKLSGAAVQSRSSAPRVRLSCEDCRLRKVKCDKLSPCTSCVRLGFACRPVERARLPRGRARKLPERDQGFDRGLADRVAKLEQLLKQVTAERDGDSTSSKPPPSTVPGTNTKHGFETEIVGVKAWQDHPSMTMSPPHRPRPSTTYLASSFWEDIMQQTQELRAVLDDRLENEQLETRQPSDNETSLVSSATPESVSNSPVFYRGGSISALTRRSLCEIYLRNVDPVFKILHRPSLIAFLHDEQPYLDYELDHQVPATLASAVYYAAVCTMDDSQCQLLFGTDKTTVSANLQRQTDAMLRKADFVATNELTVLQAYVISLLAARCQDQSRRVWTMLAMALRVGQALCLHMRDPPFHVNPFEQEMRRRTWQAIGVLDMAASLDRASEPMMQSAWLMSHPPANINDEDIWFDMVEPFEESPEGTFTDMTHTLIIAEAQSVARSIAFTDFIEEAVKIMSIRQQKLNDFQRTVSTLLTGSRPELSAFQLYVRRTATIIHGWLQLGILRPISRSRHFTPPPVPGDWLLRLAADNLQKAHESYSDPTMAPWAWFGSLWVPWHGLAVALAEMCVCKDPVTLSKYWPVVEETYHRSSFLIADSQHGMLWKPLEKLMDQARTHKRELLGNESPCEAIDQVSPGDIFFASVPERPMQPIKPELLNAEQLNAQAAANSPLRWGTSNIATGHQFNPAVAIPQTTMPFTPFPNICDEVDFADTELQGPIDNNAWVNYDNFIGDLYASPDCFFLPR
ncbi:hypothetical protein N7510_005701 [Penicillium lagena]|uniref:uncharacterized protein n=1 Tax=Penicillium lagena TaxID=94218 RepID=UPI00254176AC|nr:uncharacterized protein N7510_005701 [Penicillium lagena]KAJ5612507.1 hypothetical protein N7510_005701 [Penicillium lagena]